ncbi:MAG: hypothetical protein NTX25_12555 [Proteobacteria bacterium]|nr:hypothetical protein [Pseudomonadota bacterium]
MRPSPLLLLLLTACLSSPEPEISYPLEARDDPAYFTTYEANSKTYEVIHNFEAKYTAHITRVTPEFREALIKRYEHIWNESQTLMTEAGAKTAFFVTLYTANRNMENISDANLWNIQLQAAGKIFKPSSIKNLSPKERWQPFFPQINQWSKDFLLIFELTPEQSGGSLKLLLNSPDGSVRSDW